MIGLIARAILAALVAAVPAWAQPASTTPVPPRPPAAVPARPPAAAQRPAPVVAPRPGASGRPGAPPRPGAAKPGKPRKPPRPVSRPPVPAVVPVPTPAPPAPEPEKPAEPGRGSNTGQPLPRYATLRSDEVNLRSGPGTRYPIEWVYKRRDLPVQIEREFEVWRLVRDQEGVKGWVHQAVLAPRRTGVVVDGEKPLRRDPKDDSVAVARLKPGVIVRLRSCEQGADWCQGQVQDYRGWIRRGDIWGTFPGEAIQ